MGVKLEWTKQEIRTEPGLISLQHREITEEILEWKVAHSVQKTEINGSEDPLLWLRGTSTRKLGTNFVDKRRSLGRYSSVVV
jgi:hypothetical protein